MKIITFLMMTFVMNLGIAQELIVVKEKLETVSKTRREYQVIDNGLDTQYGYFTKQGYYKEFFKKDAVVSGHYKQDKKEGDWIYKDPEENYLQKGKFHKGKKIGEWYSYKKDVLSTKEYYSNKGRLDSVFRYNQNDELVGYYNYDPVKKINYTKEEVGLGIKKEVIRIDSINLKVSYFYSNGQLLEERNFENERLIKVSDIYDKNGNVLVPSKINGGDGVLQTIYLDSVFEGKFSVKDEISYKNGMPEGLHKIYDIKGKLLSEGVNKEGLPYGKWKNWSKKKNKYSFKKHTLNSKKKKENIKVYSANRDVVEHGLPKEIRNPHSVVFMKNRNKIDYSNHKKYFSEIVNKCVKENINPKELSKYFPVSKERLHRIAVKFKINTLGEVSDVNVKPKSKSVLVKHAIENVLGKLPTLIPAGTSERGTFVNLLFNLPISFRIEYSKTSL